jgi:hypothetical protein
MEMSIVREQLEEKQRDAILVEDAALIRMMGFPVLEGAAFPDGALRTGGSVHPRS